MHVQMKIKMGWKEAIIWWYPAICSDKGYFLYGVSGAPSKGNISATRCIRFSLYEIIILLYQGTLRFCARTTARFAPYLYLIISHSS